METSISETTEQNVRPQFLKVVCIISFIGCGLMILLSLMGLSGLFMSAEDMLKTPYYASLQSKFPEAYQLIADALQYKNIKAITDFLVPCISMFGVIQMWKMRKRGYYIYLVGEFLPYIIGPLILSENYFDAMLMPLGDTGHTVKIVIMSVIIVFDILFIAVYGLNFKHLK